jgi:hypothetical protein
VVSEGFFSRSNEGGGGLLKSLIRILLDLSTFISKIYKTTTTTTKREKEGK